MDAEMIEELKDFVEHRNQNPSVQSLGARIPAFGESVEPNANNHQKYECLHKDEELRKTENERKRRRDAEAASVLKYGEIITILSGSELKNILNAASETSRLSVLYFTATWCRPCRYIAPVFTSLAVKYPNAVFLKVDIEEARDAAAEWRPSTIPCFFFVKNGVEICSSGWTKTRSSRNLLSMLDCLDFLMSSEKELKQ